MGHGKRQKVADNYLSLKAYAVASADLVVDYRKKGKNGRNLSSVGDLLQTVAALGAVKPPKAEGLGMGGKTIPSIFTGKKIKVGGQVAAINGLVNEYATSCAQVRARWPMGLGKYLLDKLAARMSVYESVLAKLTAKLSVPHKPAKFYAKAPDGRVSKCGPPLRSSAKLDQNA